jgi:hypothetical protein
MVELMQQGTTITLTLCSVIQNKKRGMPKSGAVPFHDNVCPHTAGHTRALMELFKCKVSDHLPYRPHLTQYDYHPFTY